MSTLSFISSCSIHPTSKNNYYCIKCNKSLCYSCSREIHASHPILTLEEYFREIDKQLPFHNTTEFDNYVNKFTAQNEEYKVNIVSKINKEIVLLSQIKKQVEESLINNTNIKNVDATSAEQYGAITVWSTAAGATVTVAGGEITVAGDSRKAYVFPADATVEGVDDVGYIVATVGAAGFTSLQSAIEFAKAGDTITLIRDVTLSEIVKIEKKITLDLGGKKVTSTAQKAFEIYANATIQNGTIKGVNRCVDTRKSVTLTLTDVTLVADNYSAYGNPQPLTIGGSENGTEVIMNGVTISANAGYGIITFVKTELIATDSTISGYSALYVKPGSEGSTFNFVNCDLSGSTGTNDVEGNSFSTIAVRANNVTVNVDENSIITASSNYSYAISLGGNYAGEESVTGAKVTIAGEIRGNILPKAPENNNVVAVKSTYADKLKEDGYAVSDAKDGMISVIGVILDVSDKDSLLAAIENAKPGDIVLLEKDFDYSGKTLVLNKGITLDLNGHTLTVDYFVAFKGNNIVDNSVNEGKLFVSKDKVMFSQDNAHMAIYVVEDEETSYGYYMFAKVYMGTGYQTIVEEANVTDSFKVIYRPKFNGEYVGNVTDILANSIEDSGVQFIVRLSWYSVDENGYSNYQYQDFVLNNDLIEVTLGNASLMFNLIVNGVAEYDDLVVTTIIKSNSGVEYSKEVKIVNATN
jgi:hypothetical protein